MFEYNQPKSSEHIKCNSDCMIRAVSIATKTDYGTVHKLMYNHGWRANRRKSKGPFEDQILNTLKDLGYKVNKISFPAEKGVPRMSGIKMAQQYQKGIYIMRMAKHVSALVNGSYHDTFDCGYKCVYYALQIIKQ